MLPGPLWWMLLCVIIPVTIPRYKTSDYSRPSLQSLALKVALSFANGVNSWRSICAIMHFSLKAYANYCTACPVTLACRRFCLLFGWSICFLHQISLMSISKSFNMRNVQMGAKVLEHLTNNLVAIIWNDLKRSPKF